MKHETQILIGKGFLVAASAFIPFLLLYLVGAFMAFSWDAGKWGEGGRAAVGLLGLLLGGVSGGLTAIALYYPRWFKS